jgi:hypothetical protein
MTGTSVSGEAITGWTSANVYLNTKSFWVSSFKMWQNNVLLYDLRPAMSGNTAGFYDMLTKTMLPSQSGVSLVAEN